MFEAAGAVHPSFVGSQVVIFELSAGGASHQTVVAGLVWLSVVVAAGAPGAKKRSPEKKRLKIRQGPKAKR